MSLSQIKHFLVVGFLGATLVGCSSSPEVEETDTGSQPVNQNEGDILDTPKHQIDLEKAAAEKAAADKALADQAAALLAQLEGKVVNFDFDRAEVKEDFYNVVKMHAEYMSLNKDASLTVKGYCDERGTQEYNLALGERRANAVKNALVAQGVSPSRISVISFGEENAVDAGHNEAAWAKNRRTEFSY